MFGSSNTKSSIISETTLQNINEAIAILKAMDADKKILFGSKLKENLGKNQREKRKPIYSWVYSCDLDDANFPEYNANVINNAHVVACEGPKDVNALGYFFKDIVFNEKIMISNLIALGDHVLTDNLPADCTSCGDFIGYFQNREFGSYQVESTCVSGKLPTAHASFPLWMDVECRSASQFLLNVTNLSTSEHKEIPLYLYGSADNESIQINADNISFFHEIYQSYLHSLEKDTFLAVNCAAGWGRTGNLIATLLFTLNFENIFVNKTPQEAVDKILELLNGIREDRVLVFTIQQLIGSIEACREIYKYHQNHLKLDSAKEENKVPFKIGLFEGQRSAASATNEITITADVLSYNIPKHG